MGRVDVCRQDWRSPRRTVATFTTYVEAQRAVGYLSDQELPVARVAIVAEGLRFVEQVTGRRGPGRAALNGVGSGALTVAPLGFHFGLFSWVTPVESGLSLALYGMIVGANIGAILGLIAHALSGRRRDFTPVGGMQAERHTIAVDEDVAVEPDRILLGLR